MGPLILEEGQICILTRVNLLYPLCNEIPCSSPCITRRAATHMKTKHTPNEDLKFKCDICGKGFISNGKLQNHVNIHTGAKPYKCKFCTAAFGDSANHRAHERAHLGHK